MKFDTAFPKRVLAALAIVGGLGVYPLVAFGSREVVIAAMIGALLSTVNVLSGFLAIEYSAGRSYTTFLKAVVGGMGIRIAVLLAMLFMLIKFAGVHATALAVSLLGFYLVFLVLEIIYIQKKVETKSQR